VTVSRFQLAQVNIARMRAPLDDPRMQGFVSQIESINALADRSPGFVWRLQSYSGDATAIRAYDDDRILFNMSVWESLESLRHFVYRSGHVDPLRARRRWFEPLEAPILALWWVVAGHRPSVEEAKERLARLKSNGPTREAFDFGRPFSLPEQTPSGLRPVDAELRDPAV
jgi:hypothetical protein